MDTTITNGNSLDLYTINADYTGSRSVNNKQEIVEFHNGTTMRIWFNYQSEGFSSHWHNALEIIQPMDNYYNVVIDEKLFHLIPGDILIIPPGQLHELISPESGKRFIYLFDISMINKLKGFSSIQSLLAQPQYVTRDTCPQIYEDTGLLLMQMRNEYFSKTEYGELMVYSLLLHFFVKLGNNHLSSNNFFPNVRLYKQKEYIQKFNDLMDFIDAHYMEDMNLEQIAAAIGFSKYHFSRLFKQYTGYTFCDYVNNRRIKVAEELLTRPDLSITEVALQSGFPSISTFNRLFKQEKNCTPSEYRVKNAEIRFHS